MYCRIISAVLMPISQALFELTKPYIRKPFPYLAYAELERTFRSRAKT